MCVTTDTDDRVEWPEGRGWELGRGGRRGTEGGKGEGNRDVCNSVNNNLNHKTLMAPHCLEKKSEFKAWSLRVTTVGP